MGVIIGLLIFSAICFAIVKLIDEGQSSDADRFNDEFLEDLKETCEKNQITYQEPKSFKKALDNSAGYKYEYFDSVSFDGKDGIIDPAIYWIDEDKKELNFVGRSKAFKIALDKIEMYTKDGEIKYNSIVKNNGKKVSLSGAIVGSVIAGAPGMIIGATKDRNDIETDIEENDDRKIYVYYRNEENEVESFTVEKYYFSNLFRFYDFINKKLPTKSDKYILSHQDETQVKEENIDDTKDKLTKLKKLFEDGLIDEEEYKNTKKEMLNNLK